MSLPTPNLDDRKFQDIVSEARSMIPRYCPEWTDHNLSDPGITLIELFAWMTDILLYRLNKVPDKNYLKFLELIGVKLAPPAPAIAEITFRLSAPQSQPINIPRGTEIATVRTEKEEAITFTTIEDLRIETSTLSYMLLTHDNVNFVDFSAGLHAGTPVEVFKSIPEEGNAFYLGYEKPLNGNILVLTINCDDKRGIGVNPEDPPLLWEYWNGEEGKWSAFERYPESIAWLERDGTRALNKLGDLVLHAPLHSFSPTEINLQRAYWIRCRVAKLRQEQPMYKTSPRILGIKSCIMGGSVIAEHSTTVTDELLGTSTGTSGQSFKLKSYPVLPRRAGETVEVQDEDGNYEPWIEVEEFSEATTRDKCFTLDSTEGNVVFGPSVRQPNGGIMQYGKVPPKGKLIRFSSYRHGGGREGNVGRGTITVLKSSIPYVSSVTNRRAATGGVDTETIENAKLRGPQVLRTRNRAVTEDDFEFLAKKASPSVARAKCIQPREITGENQPPPGTVYVAIIPEIASNDETIVPDQLEITHELQEQVRRYLNERRLLTVTLIITNADYKWVSIKAKIRVKPRFDARQVRHDVDEKLHSFLNPLTGGLDGNGWPFGHDLILPEVYSCIQSVRGVEYTETLSIFLVNPLTGERGEALQRVAVPPAGVICSYKHEVTSEEI